METPMPARTPRTVQLRYHRPDTRLPRRAQRPIRVETVDARTGAKVTEGDLRTTAAWLADQGYRYLPGTQAVWSRA
jgi:hypothetical protein